MARGGLEYDVVLWGATGFTGRFVAEHLAEHYSLEDLDWAIAGRNADRLSGLRDQLTEYDPDLASLDILTGDALDRDSLDAIAERTSVVCSTVGPYAEYGSGLVEACLDARTDYCDLTGELHWIRQMIDAHHATAADRGVRIVHACGFDAVPSDLGTLLVQSHAVETIGSRCSRVDAYVSTNGFGLSGGTYASILGVYAAAADDPAVRRVVAAPYALAPAGERAGPDEGPQRRPVYDERIGQWTGPFAMALINEKVVRRSNALLGYPWGRDFQYREVTPTGDGLAGAARASIMAVGAGAFTGAMSVSPLRRLLDRYVFPDPGEGPDREAIEGASFEVRLVGSGTVSGREGSFRVAGRIAADRHPGYGATPEMLGEAAIALATGDVESPLDGGVLTPAAGIGPPLIERLRDVGMTVAVE